MKLIRNLLALIGLVAVLGAVFGYVAWGSRLAAFDPGFPQGLWRVRPAAAGERGPGGGHDVVDAGQGGLESR
jgi:hypothetical protein